ncbi:putative DnaJ domain-containing protein [Lupinus albus]|uniref:Putative DnaJ domain-containing protein n=1 Tax=Lupinus albus TaxID=3870 RepID=A0A6A4Q2M2_LUPAL|nr:putative DnaJ domain-containing protein [Lupinus albus]
MATENGSKQDPQTLIRSCASFLACRDFNTCRQLAHCIPRSDPNIIVQVDQILTIVHVLSAAQRRVSDANLDWYSILRLRREDSANRDLVRQQFKNLMRLLNPNNNKFPFADDALMRVREGWFVISDPVRRASFDREIDEDKKKGTSFWTMCPYCWYLHEYERKYEDCTFRCGNCQKTFHGVEVKPPTKDMMVEGKEQYYCYQVSLPCRYPVDENIIRDSNGGIGLQSNGKKRMRMKTMARRVRMKGFIEENSDADTDVEQEGVL